MKKKIVVLSAALMLFAGVVSASSINGDYKGNPIVKVMSNGKQLEVDEVPAQIYDGHTVVPISLLRQIGASVTWNDQTYSVNVQMPNEEDKWDKINHFILTADKYFELRELAERVKMMSQGLSIASDAMRLQKTKTDLDKRNEQFNESINQYNDFVNKGYYNEPIMVDILNEIYSAIDDYKGAFADLYSFYSTGDSNKFYSYLNNDKNAFDKCFNASTKAKDNYKLNIFYASEVKSKI